MAARGSYQTKQRVLVSECLQAHADRYLSVDDVCALVKVAGGSIGRTTVYRQLESLVASGTVLKAQNGAGEACYCRCPEGGAGQLICVECGSVQPLTCHELESFSEHVREHHGFAPDLAHTVLYGRCAQCQKEAIHV